MVRKQHMQMATDGKHLFVIILSLWLLIPLALFAPPLHALDIVPFETVNQSPIVQIFGLPPRGHAILLVPGGKEFRAVLDHSSNYVKHSNDREMIVLDGETTRMTLGGRYGLSKNVEVGIAIPYLVHGGGFLDEFIIDYHNALGISQGGREQAPRNRLLYRYSRDGVTKLNLASSDNGIGDISLTTGFQIYKEAKEYPRAVALRASVKLPTGDSDSLHGSGSNDAAVWLTGSNDYKLPLGHGALFAAAGFMAMTEGKVLPEQQVNHVAFGTVGVGWNPLSWIALKTQLDAHTAFYKDSDLRALSANAAQLVMGGTLRLSERITLDIGITEDIATTTAPDVSFHFNMGYRF